MIKYLSLFSGIGGFEKGIEQAYENLSKTKGAQQGRVPRDSPDNEQSRMASEQPTCIGFSEIDKYATSIYQNHYPTHKNYGDIKQINENELPDFDLLVGGFPCQSFSIAGKRGGFADTRGTLFFDIARILREKQPTNILLENVKGLLNHDEGRTFGTIINTLDELGYDIQWQVLNSKDFGVPQNRERVLIVGHLRGGSRPKIFPFSENSGADIILPTLTARYFGAQANGGYIGEKQAQVGTYRTHKSGQGFRASRSGLVPTIPARAREDGSGQPVVAIPVLTPDRVEKRQNGRRFKEDGDPSFTLTAQDRHGLYDGMRVRRFTPTECERLQGFPDHHTKYGTPKEICVQCHGAGFWDTTKGLTVDCTCKTVSDTQRYKTLGNAVTVNVIQAVMERLLLSLETI